MFILFPSLFTASTDIYTLSLHDALPISFGLHSSSSTTSSYSYFAFASALRNLTARSAELRPPSPLAETPPVNGPIKPTLDRKSTRLNSSHTVISYAVFCLKKKNTIKQHL